MRHSFTAVSLALAAACTLAQPAFADFSGQTILGPLTNGSTVLGNNTGASDDNDGWYSGGPVFFIWDGGDDVYRLNWPGGDMSLQLTYDSVASDPDIFLFTPGSLDESAYDNIGGSGLDIINVAGAAAGTYYINIDTTAGREGPYQLSVIPAPATLGLLATSLLLFKRSRHAG